MGVKHLLYGLLFGCIAIFANAGEEHDHKAEEDHDDHDVIRLAKDQQANLNLEPFTVVSGTLKQSKFFPAELQFDPNRTAHLTPRVAGVVGDVRFGLGDRVKAGSVMAILESRELGMAKAAYLAAQSRQTLREKIFAREKRLWEKRISAERDYLEAERELVDAGIETERTKQSLFALGISKENLKQIGKPGYSLNRYAMVAPFDGVIVEQHITRGELLNDTSKAFVMVDTRRIWAIARVNERDIRLVNRGQPALIEVNAFPGQFFEGKVDYLSDQLDRETRSLVARVVLSNDENRLRAGMFGTLSTWTTRSNPKADSVLVPRSALQRDKDGQVVFLKKADGMYRQLSVRVLSEGNTFAEVIGDLHLGDQVATGDTFVLKSMVDKEEMGSGHSH